MGLNKKIVLISSGQPSANPRLVKEAVTLYEEGYEVTVIFVPISPWADPLDEVLFQKYEKINFIRTGFHPYRQKWLYLWSRVRRKINFLLFRNFGDMLNCVDYSIILFGQELLKVAKQHKADIYIAHNLGALPVAVKVSLVNNALVGFDAEDFHRGEFKDGSLEKYQNTLIEEKYFPQLKYLSVSSPLIGDAYKSLFPKLMPLIINNVVSIQNLPKQVDKVKVGSELKLFWFSQTIGKTRGIENIIRSIGLLKNYSVHLTLLGNASEGIKEYFLKLAAEADVNLDQISFIPPVLESEIVRIASESDVGLGSEIPYCLNREYCLTNKIFTYLLAGIALILSNTEAQKKFLQKYPGIGTLYNYDEPQSLALVLQYYIENKGVLAIHQENARRLAKEKLNWEVESKKFKNLVQTTLQS